MAEVDIRVPPPQDSPKNIINILNNDCLQAILLEIKDVHDFYRAAKVCTRFQNNAKECFPFKKLRIAYTLEPRGRIHDIVLFDDADAFLSVFGSEIKFLECDFLHHNPNYVHYYDNKIETMAKYCGNTLVELQITRGEFKKFRPFQMLKKLKLINGSIHNFDPVVAFPELKNLHLDYVKINNMDWIAHKFSNLECINFAVILSFKNIY